MSKTFILTIASGALVVQAETRGEAIAVGLDSLDKYMEPAEKVTMNLQEGTLVVEPSPRPFFTEEDILFIEEVTTGARVLLVEFLNSEVKGIGS